LFGTMFDTMTGYLDLPGCKILHLEIRAH